ncbi:hypothetical protein [Bradyrhizobium sp. STM 3557]|uniref:hypothetical protein n=1 Tax=Bradyrhizobium sp. STM 3557 TaxID=578920 RepID=UPI00388E4E01
MNQASFSLKAINPVRTECEAKPQRAGYFNILFAMLRHSRRLQAERVLRQYGHLFERAGQPLDLTKLGDC